MRRIDRWRLRLRTLFHREQLERELSAEFEFHVEQQTAENLAAGMSAEEARYAALRSTGAVTRLQEQCRDERGLQLFETTMQDVRYAMRCLRQSPAFTMVAVLSLALGIGANTAIFSLIDSILLSSLPVKDPQQLVFVRTSTVKVGLFNVSTTLLNRDVEQMQKQATQLAGIASSQNQGRLSVAVAGNAELASGDFVSGNYFRVLGISAQTGRTIVPADNLQAGNTGSGWPAVISDGYWRRRFGTNPNVIGQRITINTIPFVIVGVLPAGFGGLSIDESADVMMPIITQNQVSAGSASAGFPKPENSPGQVFARIKSGASPSKAAAELSVIFRGAELSAENLTHAQQEALAMKFVEFEPAAHGSSFLRQRFAEPLQVLMAVVAMVMLIACANIASLLLAKASARQKEIAIRLSLGSSRRRIIRQLLTESLMLSIMGCVVGIFFAVFARDLTVTLGANSAQASGMAMPWDFRLIAFLATICVLTALLFGIMPALRATRVDPNEVLKSSQATDKAGRLPYGRILATGQLALSLALVAGSGLFLATLHNLYEIDLGFHTENLLMASLDPGLIGFDDDRTRSVYVQLLHDLSALPSVSSASLTNEPLLSSRAHLTNAKVPGYVAKPGEDPANAWTLTYNVGPRYFETVRMPLIAGRDFGESDNESAPAVVIVNEALAKHYFPGTNPIGRKIQLSSIFKAGTGDANEGEIVGLVRNAHYFTVTDEYQAGIFVPLLQLKSTDFSSRQTLLVRTNQNPASLAGDVRAVARRIDPNLPLFDLRSMTSQLDRSLSQPRLMAVFSSFFGFLALTLSAIGLYGVLAYGVNKRKGEIGIRMALGANRSSILKLILEETASLVAIGVAAGLALAWAASRLAKSMLYGLSPHDSRVFAVSALLLVVVALFAALLPARRAVRVDPMVALRYE